MVPVLIRASSASSAELQDASDGSDSSDDSSKIDLAGDSGITVPKNTLQKDGDAGAPAPAPAPASGPTAEGVHVDTPVWSDGRKKRSKKSKVAKSSGVEDDSIPNTIRKDAEQRYTLGPWYVPNRGDAHGEWTDPQELQQALWGYVKNGDRDIRLQHNVDIVAGEWLEAMTWPHEVEVPMIQADTGSVSNVKFPPGTVFLGVQWKPWAWELVKQGKIRGYSIGGTGAGIEVDMPETDETPPTFPVAQTAPSN